MLKPRWLKVIRDLSSNKTRTLLVVLSIAVGVTAIGMVLGSQNIIDRDLPAAYQAVNPASATAFTLSTFDDDLVNQIQAMPEVGEAEGRRFVVVRFRTAEGEWRNMQLFAVPNFDNIKVNKLTLEEGEWPPPTDTVLIERSSFVPTLGMGNTAVGDTLTIEPPDGKQRQLEVAGIAHDLNQFPAVFANTAYGYITYDTLANLGEPRDYNLLNFIVAENRLDADHVKTVSDSVQDRLERSGVAVIFVLAFTPGEHPLQFFLTSMSTLLGAMGILSLLLSAFLIVNTLAAILTQQVRQIGIMKAIGARTHQVTLMYFIMVLIFGLLSLFIAIPLGALGSIALARLFADFLNFNVNVTGLDPGVVAIQVVIALTVPLLAAIVPVIKGARTTVREAISEHGLGKGQFGHSIVDDIVVGLKRIIPMQRPAQISLRNTFRRKGRLTLTLITLSLASAIFISIFSVRASLQDTLADALRYFDYDVQIQFSRPYRVARIEQEALRVPGVEEVESWGIVNARRVRPDGSESDSIITYAPPADSTMIDPVLVSGRWLEPGDTNTLVVNTEVLRDDSDIGLGSLVTMKIDGREQEFTVVGIARSAIPTPSMYANYDYMSRLTNSVGLGQIAVVQITDDSTAGQTRVGQALEQQFRDSGFRVEITQTTAELESVITLFFDVVIVFLLAMAALLGLVGGLGLMGTMSINVIERLREIGVMRAIGASDRSVLRIVLLEGIIIGLLSWLVGGLVAVPTSYVLATQVGTLLLRAEPNYTFSFGGTALWLVTVILLAIFASFLPARSASRVTVREVLSYE
jgi:putative ABC transport system permease protein